MIIAPITRRPPMRDAARALTQRHRAWSAARRYATIAHAAPRLYAAGVRSTGVQP